MLLDCSLQVLQVSLAVTVPLSWTMAGTARRSTRKCHRPRGSHCAAPEHDQSLGENKGVIVNYDGHNE